MTSNSVNVVTKRLNAYKGDPNIQIRIKDKGRIFSMFNIWRRSVRGLVFYENDRYTGITFKNVTEAKNYALRKYIGGKG